LILGDTTSPQIGDGPWPTLDDLFRQTVARRPNAIALADPPDRKRFTDGAPRRLTYREADHVVGAIAGRLRRLGLPTDAVIALQFANTVEAALTTLGVLRAGMIAAPLPLLWRRDDAIAALKRLGVKAIVTCARAGGFDHCGLAMQIAAEIFQIRYVCAFGSRFDDGVMQFDDLFAADAPDPLMPIARARSPASHVAVISFEVTPKGVVAVARNHIELTAGGLATLLEGGIARRASILSTVAPSSFAGLALGMVPWLLSGGTLHLHQPFDPDAFAMQCRTERCDSVMLPGPLVPQLVDAGLLSHQDLRNVFALWRAPERLTAGPPWFHASAGMVDVTAFGETGVIAARRGADGRVARVPFGALAAPRDAPGAVTVVELALTKAGTVALRGAMVPRHPFPPGIERGSAPCFKADAAGLVDTGYTCRTDRIDDGLTVTGPPPGLADVGGYRFVMRDLQAQVAQAIRGATFAALPDALTGHRLAGHAADGGAARAALTALGVNPLIVEAFGQPGKPHAA
jgi:hypothetical protein